MKNQSKWLKMSLIIGAYVLASLFAVAFKPANVETGLHWFEYDQTSQSIGSYIGTTTAELIAAGCPNESAPVTCALGFDDDDVDLSNPGSPELIPEAADDPIGESEDSRMRSNP